MIVRMADYLLHRYFKRDYIEVFIENLVCTPHTISSQVLGVDTSFAICPLSTMHVERPLKKSTNFEGVMPNH